MPKGSNPVNGLTAWRVRQAEEKRLKLLELAMYREHAVTVERDGREFTLIRIPDGYDAARAEKTRQKIVPRRKNRQATA